MDVEKLKKMNQLAKTLRNQGFVANQDDAAKIAGQIVGRAPEQEIANLKITDDQKMVITDSDTGDVLIKEGETKEEKPEQRHSQVVKDTYSKEEITNVLQKFADQFCTEINKITDKVVQQEKMLNEITNALNNLEKPTARSEDKPQTTLRTNVPEEKRASAPEQKPVEQPKPVQQEAPKENGDSPRSGGYSSDDVSVEKFFYFGQKKD